MKYYKIIKILMKKKELLWEINNITRGLGKNMSIQMSQQIQKLKNIGVMGKYKKLLRKLEGYPIENLEVRLLIIITITIIIKMNSTI